MGFDDWARFVIIGVLGIAVVFLVVLLVVERIKGTNKGKQRK